MSENPATQEAAQLTFDEGRKTIAIVHLLCGCKEGLEVLLQQPVQDRPFRLTTFVAAGEAQVDPRADDWHLLLGSTECAESSGS